MKKGIHPELFPVDVKCVCGESFKSYSTSDHLNIGICNKCHPYYTGQQKFVDTVGRIKRFMNKFGENPSYKK